MKIYTRTGDQGTTGLFGGRRVSKSNPRVDAYGTIDELNAALGLSAALLPPGDLRQAVERVQASLFDLGADVATPPDASVAARLRRVDATWVAELEEQIDAMDAELAPLARFILPGGASASAALHLARTVCRRAERSLAAAAEQGERLNPAVLPYVNRLGDWLFTAARLANARAGVADVAWAPRDDSAPAG